uniref:TLDc domain-containing protein n=1 Tax=Terrapene triunguis TaxID=2587831 RepID=A0A674J742_9SAUR
MEVLTISIKWEEQLQHLLESRCLSLLYKASIHGYNASIFHAKCDAQGPTVAYINDEKAFLFRLKGKEGVLSPLQIPVKTATSAIYDHSSSGPNFGGGALQLLDQNAAAAATSSNNNYTYNVADLHGNDLGLMECEVYRVEGKLISKEKMFTEEIIASERGKIMEEIRSYKPYLNSVPQIRILVLGPIGAGKSIFFNSVNSVFQGYVPSQAVAGSDNASMTTQVNIYNNTCLSVPEGYCENQYLYSSLNLQFFGSATYYYKKNSLQFNPAATPHPDSPGYIKMPFLKDQIHCVAFVIDGCKISAHNILKFCKNLHILFVKITQYNHISFNYFKKLGIPLAQIVPVKNYCSELDLLCDVDILLLSAVRQLIRLAESYLDNFTFEKSKKEL